MGSRRLMTALNPDNRAIIPMKFITPSPAKYDYPTDNHNFKNEKRRTETKESKFFMPKNMPTI
jgi:hypothetical protein